MSTSRLPAFLRSHGGTVVLAAVLLAIFLPYLRAGFVLDDFLHLERVTRGAGVSTLDYCIRTEDTGLRFWWLPHGVEVHFFRPLVLLFLRGEERCFGMHAAPFHAASLLLHSVNVLLCFLIGRRLGLARRGAMLAAIGWGVSIHTVAAVGWISAQSELLVAGFVLGAVYFFLRAAGSQRGGGWLVASGGMVVLALLSKEAAVAAPLLMVAVRPRGAQLARRSSPWFFVVVSLLVAVYVALRVRWLAVPPSPYFEAVHSIGDVLRIVAKVLRYLTGAALGIPVLPLVLDRTRDLIVIALLGVAAMVALLRVARYRARREVLWFAAALVPYLLVMPASLYLYMATCGVFWLLARAIQDGSRAARVWMTWLVVTGIAGHLLAAGYLHDLSSSITRAERVTVRAAAAHGDIVLVDAPWWSYCLPAAARLDDPSFDATVNVVSFSPALGGSRTALEWTSPREFNIRRPGGFFRSPLERFFLFDGDPCLPARDGEVNVAPRCENGSPVMLNVTANAAVFIFDGGEMVAAHP